MNCHSLLVTIVVAQSNSIQSVDIAVWMTLLGLGAMVLILIFIGRSMLQNQSNEEDLEMRSVHLSTSTSANTQCNLHVESPPPYTSEASNPNYMVSREQTTPNLQRRG
jgi:hypothetical protein